MGNMYIMMTMTERTASPEGVPMKQHWQGTERALSIASRHCAQIEKLEGNG